MKTIKALRGSKQPTVKEEAKLPPLPSTVDSELVVPVNHVEQIQDYGLAMNMSGIVVDKMQEIHKEFMESGGTIQRTKVSSYLQVASLYIAARPLGQMKMMKDMALVTDVKQRDIRKGDIKIRSLAPSALVRDFNVHINAAGDADADTDADGEEMALLIPELENDPYVKAAVDRLCKLIRSAYLHSRQLWDAAKC